MASKQPPVFSIAQEYQMLPVKIEAVRLTKTNIAETTQWVNTLGHDACPYSERMTITTHAGVMEAELGDWIIRGVEGEFNICKPGIFKKCYSRIT
jgi:hypothetical protein